MSTIVEKFHSMEYGPAPEDPKEVNDWLDGHHRAFGHFINGAFTAVSQTKPANTFTTRNPATGETIAQIATANIADVDARSRKPPAKHFRHGKPLPDTSAPAISTRLRGRFRSTPAASPSSKPSTMENPSARSRDIDIPLVSRHFYHHAGWAQLVESEFPGYVACGVVSQIIPNNT